MSRLKRLFKWLLLALIAFMLFSVGEQVAVGFVPKQLTINAFLFLVGLGSVLSLLSPPSQPGYRQRW